MAHWMEEARRCKGAQSDPKLSFILGTINNLIRLLRTRESR